MMESLLHSKFSHKKGKDCSPGEAAQRWIRVGAECPPGSLSPPRGTRGRVQTLKTPADTTSLTVPVSTSSWGKMDFWTLDMKPFFNISYILSLTTFLILTHSDVMALISGISCLALEIAYILCRRSCLPTNIFRGRGAATS